MEGIIFILVEAVREGSQATELQAAYFSKQERRPTLQRRFQSSWLDVRVLHLPCSQVSHEPRASRASRGLSGFVYETTTM